MINAQIEKKHGSDLQIAQWICLFIAFFVLACSTTPTGRRQINLVSDEQMNHLGQESFEKIKKETPTTQNQDKIHFVECVSNYVLQSLGESPSEWEVVVFEDKNINAFALPGKKIGVFTGILKVTENQHQLAAIIGHEIGHVVAEHGNERLSQNLLVQAGMSVADLALGRDSQKSQMILAGLGLGAQFGVLLPFSRKHESEADLLGMKYMAQAGFNPKGSVALWQRMKQASKGAPPEFLSTHPSPDSRIKELQQHVPQYMPLYEQSNKRPHCQVN